MDRVRVDGAELEYEVQGTGRAALLIHGALIAEAMRPLVDEPALEPFRLIRYHRRGVAGSSRPPGPTSIAEQADDAVGVLDRLGVERADLVGHSGGAMIALEVAASYPARVASLVLLEPVFPSGPAGASFIEAAGPVVDRYAAGDTQGAVHDFMALVGRADWREAVERTVPGGIEQAEKDAATFFENELPAAEEWAFGAEQAGAIACPVLSVLGTASGPVFAEGRELLHAWIPQCEDADIDAATHLLQMEKPAEVAAAVAAFLGR